MALYMDFSGTQGAIGFIAEGEPVIPVGVSIDAMPMSVKKKEWDLYQKFAKENDVYFLFEDDIPVIDFYAVPRVCIAATDMEGGFIASVGDAFSLHDRVPLVYIAPNLKCFLITQDSTQFLSIVPHWKEQLQPYDGVKLYASKEAAMVDFPITDVIETPEYQNLLKLMNRNRNTRSV